jgi:Sulfotransferase domain
MGVLGPNLFLVGAPRCGTTSLFSYLGSHPEVFAPREKEPHFYDRDVLGPGGPAPHVYRSLFDCAQGERWRLDATTTYLYSSSAPAAILEDSPDAHVVVAVRDPVAFVTSWHALQLASGRETISSVEAALAAEPDRRPRQRLPPDVPPSLLAYSELARFDEHIARWRSVFGPNRVHVVHLADLATRTEATCAGLLAALGLAPVPGQPFPHLNSGRRTRAARILRQLNEETRLRSATRHLIPTGARRLAWHTVTSALTPERREPFDAGVYERVALALTRLGVPIVSDDEAPSRASVGVAVD